MSMFIYFSFSSGLAHRYYFATLAPSIAVLISIGIYLLAQLQGKFRYIWPMMIAVVGATQLYVHQLYEGWFEQFVFLEQSCCWFR
jgi:4-amino-4-deoxy-L-arabinose transferase-like glycosyltransferase